MLNTEYITKFNTILEST